jgi:hypothetical protein
MENNNFDEKINNEMPEASAPEPIEQPAAENIPAEEVKPEEMPAEAPVAEPVEEVKPEEPVAEAPKEKPERITSIPKYEPKTYVRESASEPTYDAPVQSDDRLEGVSDTAVKTEQSGNKNKTWIIIAVVAIVLLILAACCSLTVLRGIFSSFLSRTLV